MKQWIKTDSHRTRRDRGTIDAHDQAIRAMGYSGGKTIVFAFCRQWKDEQAQSPKGKDFVPLSFEPGEAFQFDWNTEYLVIGGLHRRLEVAHAKLAASRAYLLVAYYAQAHEMLFDAHARCRFTFNLSLLNFHLAPTPSICHQISPALERKAPSPPNKSQALRF